jgi:hypothetical protein
MGALSMVDPRAIIKACVEAANRPEELATPKNSGWRKAYEKARNLI